MTPDFDLVHNNNNRTVFNEITTSLNECKSFYFNVAFISFSGLQILLETLKKAEGNMVAGKVVTSTYLNFTDPKAVKKLTDFRNVETRIFTAKSNQGFHPKAYMFEYEESYKVIVGSANITQSALKSNVEWNISIVAKSDDTLMSKIILEFNKIWEQSIIADEKFLEDYTSFLMDLNKQKENSTNFQYLPKEIEPNSMQSEAIQSLERLRDHGEKKALVVAATGSGKTYMSAFDVDKVNPKRMLFVAHREDILTKARESFLEVTKIGKTRRFGTLSGSKKDYDADFLFSTNLSLSNSLDKFSSRHFDYIIIDEAHHVSGETYKRILNHFDPEFLLGMTATPERGDAQDIYITFDNNIAIEIRLRDALNEDLIVPFHYFGITDVESLDYSGTPLNNIDAVSKLLKTHSRAEHIIEHMNFYGHESEKRKGIGFCINVDHAKFMTKEFNSRGISSTCLTGKDDQSIRELAIKNLESDTGELEIIFTVDIFNEGIDIPSINTILMLRPTESPIIFIQQLGRGLRKHKSKEFVTVLDFIGNYSKSFLLAIALNGRKFFDKDSLKIAVKNDFANLPGCSHIQLDKIAKDQILSQIENENFNSMKYLKEEYESFKLLLDNNIPTLLDFFSVDGAPDPLKFIQHSKTYLNFVAKVEKNNFEDLHLLSSKLFIQLLRFVDDHLPAKRIVDFAVLKLIISAKNVTIESVREECLKYVASVPDETITHSFQYFNGDFFDSADTSKYPNFGTYSSVSRTFSVKSDLKELVKDIRISKHLVNSVNYGIYRYENEYGAHELSLPDLVLYQQYNMRDTALVANYTKKHSAFRGQGLLTYKNDFFLFIELHKNESAIQYRDRFVSETIIQWDSPNSTSTTSPQGVKLIDHKNLGIKLHLFVRKFKKIDGVIQPYIYIGGADAVSHKEENPILFQMELHNQVPAQIYMEFDTDPQFS